MNEEIAPKFRGYHTVRPERPPLWGPPGCRNTL